MLLPRQYFGAVIGSLMLTFHNPGFDIIQLGYSPLVASVAPDRGSSILLLTDRILVVQGTERIRTIDLPGSVAEPSFLSHFSLVVWSPDSTQVALTVRSTAPGGESTGLTAAIADLKTGAIHLVADGYAAGWSDDGQGLLLLTCPHFPFNREYDIRAPNPPRFERGWGCGARGRRLRPLAPPTAGIKRLG